MHACARISEKILVNIGKISVNIVKYRQISVMTILIQKNYINTLKIIQSLYKLISIHIQVPFNSQIIFSL